MTKVYIFVPLAFLAAFFGYWSYYKTGYDAKLLAIDQAARQKVVDELKEEARKREIAIKEAVALNAERKAQKAALEAAELAKKAARQDAEDAMALANSERRRLQGKVSDLKESVFDVSKLIEELKADKKRLADEKAALGTYVTLARTNEQSFTSVLEKIQAAEAARVAAAAAAAAAEAAAKR